MRALRLAWQLVPAHLRRYCATLAIAAVSLGVLLSALSFIASQSHSAATRDDGLASAVLRTVMLESYDPNEDPNPLTIATIDVLADWDGVSSVNVWDTVQVAPLAPNPNGVFDTIVLGIGPRYEAVQAPLVAGGEPHGPLEVLLPDDLARDAGVRVGNTLTIEHTVIDSGGVRTGEEVDLTVVGLYDSTVHGLDDALTAYGTLDLVVGLLASEEAQTTEWVSRHHVFPRGFATAETLEQVDPLVKRLNDAGFGATSVTTLLAGVSQTLNFLAAMTPVLWAIAGALVLAFAWTIASSIAVARRHEVGVLRVLGWSRGEVRMSFGFQMGALGAIVGIGAVTVAVIVSLSLVAASHLVPGVPLGWASLPPADGLAAIGSLPILTSLTFAIATLPAVERLARVPVDLVLREVRK